MIRINPPEYEIQWDQIFSKWSKDNKALFYVMEVKVDKWPEFYKYAKLNSTIFHPFNVRADRNIFKIHCFSDLDFNCRNTRIFTYRFILLWARVIKDYSRFIPNTIPLEHWRAIKQGLNDRGQKTKVNFLANIEGAIFFKHKGQKYIYDTFSRKISPFVPMAQIDLFDRPNPENQFKSDFFEMYCS